MSLKNQILECDDLPTEQVSVPEWGVTVGVRSLMACERDEFENHVVTSGIANVRAFLCVRTIIDPETGERLFSDVDAGALGTKSGAALDRIFAVARRLSGMSDEDIEELEGN